MTEEKIFEILLSKHYDYPKLESEAATTIANSFADIIYDTLKLKSCLPINKRLGVLKFLKTLSSSSSDHVGVNEATYTTFILKLEDQFIEINDFDNFLKQTSVELEGQLPRSLSSEVQEFYRRKKERHQKKIKRLELIKKYDQEALDKANFMSRITRNISYYETSENIIKSLVNEPVVCSASEGVDFANISYREKQTKFAYALIHLQQWTTLEKVLVRLVKYENLSQFEINFLMYLNKSVSGDGETLRQFIVKHFMFVYEKIVIDFCTKLIQLEQEEVVNFFETLLFNTEYVIIKEMCVDKNFELKLKQILYELYSYSFCNDNILKFIDFFL
jgi:hypothetical protein